MPHIPASVARAPYLEDLYASGLSYRQGKVRDTFKLRDSVPENLLLQVATDRISVFDFVLSFLIQTKGEVLTALTVFWLKTVLKGIPNHLAAYGSQIDLFLPKELQGNAELHKRAIVVHELDMIPVEYVVRGYLTGGGYDAYLKTGKLSGRWLPGELRDGIRLPEDYFPLLNPTTKSPDGHDEELLFNEVFDRYGNEAVEKARLIYLLTHDHCRERGIVKADSKYEFGRDKKGRLILGDEVATPDSSRYWDGEAYTSYEQSKGPKPMPYDKQIVRDWVKMRYALHTRNPEVKEDIEFADKVRVSDEAIELTRERYLDLFRRVTGKDLLRFQREDMKIAV